MVYSLTFRYEFIENDLLGRLERVTHNIAPYESKGVERASELSESWDSDDSLSMKTCNVDSYLQWDSSENGAGMYISQSSLLFSTCDKSPIIITF